MVLDNIVTNMTGIVINNGLLARAGSLITLFQAIGGLIIAYIIFNTISLWHNWNKSKETTKMRETLDRIDKRLERIEKRKG